MKKKQKQQRNVKKMCKNSQIRLNKYTERYSGITLISLVITIIILIILASVSISLILGENGLFSKAREATEMFSEAQKEEEEALAELEVTIRDNENLPEITDETPEGTQVKLPNEWITTDENGASKINVRAIADGKGNKIPVPKGFYYAGGDKDTGFVISDVSGDDLNNKSGGNQFVWIPCTEKQYNDAKNDVMEFNWSSNKEYKDNGDDDYDKNDGNGSGEDWSDDYTDDDISNIIEKYGTEAKDTITTITSSWEKNQTKVATDSIGKYGGFYIARYEAGIPKEADFYISPSSKNLAYNITNRGQTNKAGLTAIQDLSPVSKKGVQAWNFITQPNSKIVAENMYKGSESVGSYLVDNSAWNVICNKFGNIIGDGLSGETEGKGIKNSSYIGNYLNNNKTDYTKINGLWARHGSLNIGKWDYATTYKTGSVNVKPNDIYTSDNGTGWNRIELATGSSDDFKVYNIYDMAGNMCEWTTGHNIKNETMFVNFRGGSFYSQGSDGPVVRAQGESILTNCNNVGGFRVVLYVR